MAAEKVLMVRGGMKIFTRQKGLPGKWNPYTIYRREILSNPEDDVCGGPFPGSSFFE